MLYEKRIVPRQNGERAYLEAGGFFNALGVVLRSRRHTVFCDRGGRGFRHLKGTGTGEFLLRDELVVNRFLRIKLGG